MDFPSTTFPELSARTRDEASVLRERYVAALKPGSHVHISGICGTGTAAVASLLKQLGFVVSGSDKAFYPPMGDVVRHVADRIFEQYSAANFSPPPALVIIGNNLSRGNPEVEFVLEHQLPFASMPEVLAALLIGTREECRTSVVVSGTHGKTTTAAAVVTLFEHAGFHPGYFIGGVPKDLPSSIRAVDKMLPHEKRMVIVEGDEYDSAFFAKWPKFHSYRPDIVVMTSLEFDHADIYNSVEEIEREFIELAKQVPRAGTLIICDESERLTHLAQTSFIEEQGIKAHVVFYGDKASSSSRLLNRTPLTGNLPASQSLEFSLDGHRVKLNTSLAGRYNAFNLLAAAAVGKRLGLNAKEIQDGLEKFSGVLRRQNLVSDVGGILVFEDFAHHPTAVQATLEGLRERYPTRRLVAVFEPRSNTSRRGFFFDAYKTSFEAADLAVLLEVEDSGGYNNTNAPVVSLDVKRLTSEITALSMERRSGRKKVALSFPDVSEIKDFLLGEIAGGDVVVIMSNGDFGGLVGEVVVGLWGREDVSAQ